MSVFSPHSQDLELQSRLIRRLFCRAGVVPDERVRTDHRYASRGRNSRDFINIRVGGDVIDEIYRYTLAATHPGWRHIAIVLSHLEKKKTIHETDIILLGASAGYVLGWVCELHLYTCISILYVWSTESTRLLQLCVCASRPCEGRRDSAWNIDRI